jgi:S-methylmethionine-dependent homocysteine/selenocysteine methylase
MTTAYQRIRGRLEGRKPVLLDGPMGSELVRRGVRWRKHGLLTDTDAVLQLHEEYLAAGAQVLRTNTFQLNPRVYLNVFRSPEHMRHIGAPGLETLVPRLVETSVKLAREARRKAGREDEVPIAGVVSPLEHCYRPDLSPAEDVARREHSAQAALFAAQGVDLLFAESMNTIAEGRAVLQAGREVGLPVWVSFVLGPEGELLGREPLDRAVGEIQDGGAEAVMVNCAPPQDITGAVARLGKTCRVPFGAFAHIGRFSPPSWKFEFHPQFIETETWPPERYLAEARRWREAGATILGGCCGTGPDHIRALAGAFGGDGKGA